MPARSACLALAITLSALPALPAAAQTEPSLWDLIRPERLITRAIQMGIMSLRTQVDMVYGDLSVNPLTGTVTLTDLVFYPVVEWETAGSCEIRLDRLVIRSVPVDETDLVRAKAQAGGGTAPLDCLPPDVRGAAAMLGIDTLSLSRVTLDMDYRISSGGATTHVYALADGLAAVTLSGDFDYLWASAYGGGDPVPVALLNSARLTVENLGGWEKASPMLPPPATDPASAGAMIDAMLAEMFPQADGDLPAVGLEPFADSLKAGWTAFLADPQVLVLETGFDPSSPRFLSLMEWDLTPERMLSDLEPRLGLTSATARAVLPVALVQKAVGTPDQLTADERLTIGTAFATGIGTPRDLATARTLLQAPADAGDGPAAMALARALETREPSAAYLLALTAAAAGELGAAGLLDRIEAALPFAEVLTLQGRMVEGVEHPASALDRLSSVREEAAMRLTGKGRTRSYATAARTALIGSAAGDGESADILQDIDERVRFGGPDAAAIWAGQEAGAVELAREAWVGFDLPATFGGVN